MNITGTNGLEKIKSLLTDEEIPFIIINKDLGYNNSCTIKFKKFSVNYYIDFHIDFGTLFITNRYLNYYRFTDINIIDYDCRMKKAMRFSFKNDQNDFTIALDLFDWQINIENENDNDNAKNN
jgi:hypothetical protein